MVPDRLCRIPTLMVSCAWAGRLESPAIVAMAARALSD
jgi:hypothetical protein